MIQLQWYDKTNPIPSELWEQADALLRRSLPATEIRSKAGQRALLDNPYYRLGILQRDKVQAVLAIWELPGFLFGEHLAVDPDLRSTGIGGQILDTFFADLKDCFVFEVEPAGLSDMAARRIAFYQRHQIKLNPYPYYQLPLRAEHEPFPLNLMSWPHQLEPEEFQCCRTLIYHHVYGIAL